MLIFHEKTVVIISQTVFCVIARENHTTDATSKLVLGDMVIETKTASVQLFPS